ncbi:MAG: 2,3,4,5-tetrahydropyridine-2,6-dicarboxylate N-acetyltransferase [Thermotogota bacterium]|nr:2,3,4,5-tetrahydropyridine-2,6-dicarboxylate N-acetyltransferase [Thermotogota bacterium]
MDSYELINQIANSKKNTPVKVTLKGKLNQNIRNAEGFFGNGDFGVLYCSLDEWERIKEKDSELIDDYVLECDRRNSAIPMAELTKYNARIEPGAIIREFVEIGDGAVIMMGAVLNLGGVVGKGTMIDMNVVLGGRAQVGENCHIGAGAVLAGVIEPPSADPVVIEDNVLVGANAVIAEGVRVGKNAVIAAGSVVLSDVEANCVYAGIPARKIKEVDTRTQSKTQMIQALRNL